MNRRDWHVGRLHIIRRDYTDPPQYGWLWWGEALDVWIGQTLWVLRLTTHNGETK